MSQQFERVRQKARTRTAIVEAARKLARGGIAPSLEKAAAAATVSRATIYRYFPTQEALQVEIDSGQLWRDAEAVLDAVETPAVEVGLTRLIDAIAATVAGGEVEIRTALRVYQDTWLRNPGGPPVRRGRRMGWIDKVLEPLPPLPEEQRRRLRAALALAIGPDPVVMLKDVAGLDDKKASEVLKWAALALLRAALSEAGA